MGESVPSVRTLADGSKVTNYPDGTNVLVPQNLLSDRLAAIHDDQEAASAVKTEALVATAAEKREALTTGDAVPAEKCAV